MVDFAEYGVVEGDIAFLRQKELEGNLILVKSLNNSSTGEAASYTPASGKTFFHYKSWAVLQSTSFDNVMRADIENDGTQIDSFQHKFQITSPPLSDKASVESKVFDSLVGDGVKKFRINVTINGSAPYDYYMLGWIEDT